jgi:hypothetical protein
MKFAIILLADLLTRMIGLNPDLHSYSATMHAHVALESFPFLSTDIVATYYHKDPDLNKIAVTSGMPAIAQGFSQLFPRIEPPARWDTLYTVTQTGDDGHATTFALVPRTVANVSKITVVVDDATATIRNERWDYANGGWASVDNRYSTIQGNALVTSQTGHVEEPSYKGDVTTTLSGYQLNPNLPDSLFTQ